MMLSAALASALLVVAGPRPALDVGVEKLTAKLDLARIAGRRPAPEIAVFVDLPKNGENARRLVRAQLFFAKFSAIHDVDTRDPERVRRTGAEWLLTVGQSGSGRRAELVAELSVVDLGFWGAPISGASVALARQPVDLSQEIAAIVPTSGAGLTLATPSPWGTIDSIVLDAAVCRSSGRRPLTLAVLTTSSLQLLAIPNGRRGLTELTRFDLAKLPSSKTPSRDPIGVVRCAKDQILVGHSSVAGGHAFRVEISGRKTRLRRKRQLAGAPLFKRGDAWMLAQTSEGRNWWAASVVRDGLETQQALPAPLLDAKPWSGKTNQFVGLTDAYEVRAIGRSLQLGGPLARSGVGFAVIDSGGKTYVLTTSPTALPEGTDALTLHTPGQKKRSQRPPRVEIAGEIVATTIVSRKGPNELGAVVAAAQPASATSRLWYIRLGAAR